MDGGTLRRAVSSRRLFGKVKHIQIQLEIER